MPGTDYFLSDLPDREQYHTLLITSPRISSTDVKSIRSEILMTLSWISLTDWIIIRY